MRNLLALAAVTLATTAGAAPTLEPWTPAGVSSPMFESHAAFDPRTGDLWFVRSDVNFSGWRILTSHCGKAGWTAPADAPIAGDGVEADPFFADGGNTLWFISTRTTDGTKRPDLDIWRARRGKDGKWSTPERLPEPVNSRGHEWFPRPAKDGWLYFGSGRNGGLGKTDIWRARETSPGKWTAENLGPNLNTEGDEYEPLISPDGKRMILQAGDAYYESRRTKDGGWSPRVRLGPEINVNGSEIGAVFSPTGKTWMFARDAGEGRSGEWVVVREGGKREAWPPKCAKS